MSLRTFKVVVTRTAYVHISNLPDAIKHVVSQFPADDSSRVKIVAYEQFEDDEDDG